MAEGEEPPPAYETTVDEPPPAYDTTINEKPVQYDVDVVSSQSMLGLFNTSTLLGCTIYEIANTFENQSYGAKEDLWEKLMNNKSELTSFVEIYTIIMSLIALTLKSKNQTNKPPQNEIKLLTKQFITKLPTNSNGQSILSKEEYINNIHNILYNIHYEMTNDNPKKSNNNKIITLDMTENKLETSKEYNDAADTHLELQLESQQTVTSKRAYSKIFQTIWIFLIILCIIIQITTDWSYIWFIVFFGGCCIQSYINSKLKTRNQIQTVDITDLHFGNYDYTKKATIGILTAHFKFISVTNGNNIICNTLNCKQYEQFQSIPIGDNKIAIQTFNGKYISVLSQGILQTNSINITNNGQFEIITASNGRFGIKSYNGKYLSAKTNGTMHGMSDNLGEFEMFYICDINGKCGDWSSKFGGSGGGKFGAMGINGINEKISGVRIYGGTYVDSIEFQVNNIWKGKHGGSGGNGPKTLILENKQPGEEYEEYFNKIEIRSGCFVDYIKFYTNKCRTIEAGGNGGKYNCIGDGVNDRLVDCKGRCGAWIDGLQFKWKWNGNINNNCPGKHGLIEFITLEIGYRCDGCKQSMLPQGTTMYGCRTCDYDLCVTCHNES
eukprot:396621_1